MCRNNKRVLELNSHLLYTQNGLFYWKIILYWLTYLIHGTKYMLFIEKNCYNFTKFENFTAAFTMVAILSKLNHFTTSHQFFFKFHLNIIPPPLSTNKWGASSGADGQGTKLQAGRSRVRFPMVSLEIFYWHNPSGRTIVLESTQPLTEMSTRNISWGVKAAGV